MNKCPICGRKQYFEGICFKCSAKEERKEYLSLSDEEIKIKIEEIIENIDDEDYIDMFKKLFCYRGINTSKIAEVAFNNKIFFPKELYKDASSEIRDKLFEKLDESQEDSVLVDNILLCLSMIGDEVVLKKFYEFEKNPPKWREELYVGPSVYAESGGWSYDEDGKRTNLIYDECYEMVEDKNSKDRAVVLGKISNEKCPHCESSYVNILDIDGNDERLKFLNLNGRIKVKTCLSCLPYDEAIFCKYELNGESEVLPFEPWNDEKIEDENIRKVFLKPIVLSKNKIFKYYGCNTEDLITIGGEGNWINDNIHFKCPCCGKKMKYFAQIQGASIDFYEGTIYFEICQECKIVGTTYQQT
ncbi:MAG: hypothetical protein MSA89_02090 [Clostridium sp.]|nr:hypothetical protein [Clostridium sp.]